MIQNKKHTLAEITASAQISIEDADELAKQSKRPKPTLKTGSDQYNEWVKYLAQPGKKIDAILWRFKLTEEQKQELQADAMAYVPTEDNKQDTTTQTPTA